MRSISTIDDAMLVALEALSKEINITDFQVSDNFDLRIKIEGEQWRGDINYKIATFLLRLQHDILKLHNNCFEEKLTLKNSFEDIKNLIVTIKIHPGCTEIIAKLRKVFIAMLSRMEGKHIATVLIAWGLIAGGVYPYSKYLDHSLQVAQLEKDAKVKEEYLKITERAFNFAENSQTHLRYLAGQLEEKDKLGVSGQVMTKEDAIRKIIKKKPAEEKIETYFVDGEYSVTALNVKNQELKLSKSGFSANASTKELLESDKQNLYKICADADINNIVPKIFLRVTLQISSGIRQISIVGLGDKRDNAVDIETVVDAAASRMKSRKEFQQANLLDFDQGQ